MEYVKISALIDLRYKFTVSDSIVDAIQNILNHIHHLTHHGPHALDDQVAALH